jgi:hypothetical protein
MAKKAKPEVNRVPEILSLIGITEAQEFPTKVCTVPANGQKVLSVAESNQFAVTGVRIEGGRFIVFEDIMRPALLIADEDRPIWINQEGSYTWSIPEKITDKDEVLKVVVKWVYIGIVRNPYDIKNTVKIDRKLKKISWYGQVDKKKAKRFELFELLKSTRNIYERDLVLKTFTEYQNYESFTVDNPDYSHWCVGNYSTT